MLWSREKGQILGQSAVKRAIWDKLEEGEKRFFKPYRWNSVLAELDQDTED
jgi:hypothetical protein